MIQFPIYLLLNFFLVLVLLVNTAYTNKSPMDEKSNVLFIAVDDLNDWVGALGGHPQAITPNLDRLLVRMKL